MQGDIFLATVFGNEKMAAWPGHDRWAMGRDAGEWSTGESDGEVATVAPTGAPAQAGTGAIRKAVESVKSEGQDLKIQIQKDFETRFQMM